MHTIRLNRSIGCVEITIAGFWTIQEVDALANDVREIMRANVGSEVVHRSLYNFTDATIQSQAVVDRMRELASSPEFVTRKAALYSEGGLARLQARRVAEAGAEMRIFSSRNDAINWLLRGSRE